MATEDDSTEPMGFGSNETFLDYADKETDFLVLSLDCMGCMLQRRVGQGLQHLQGFVDTNGDHRIARAMAEVLKDNIAMAKSVSHSCGRVDA